MPSKKRRFIDDSVEVSMDEVVSADEDEEQESRDSDSMINDESLEADAGFSHAAVDQAREQSPLSEPPYADYLSVEKSELAQEAVHKIRPRKKNVAALMIANADDDSSINFRKDFINDTFDKRLNDLTAEQLTAIVRTIADEADAALVSPKRMQEFFGLGEKIGEPQQFDQKRRAYFHGLFHLKRLCTNKKVIGNETPESIERGKKFTRIFAIVRIGGDQILSTARMQQLSSAVDESDVINLLQISPPDESEQTAWQKLILYVLSRLSDDGYRRYKDCCYQQICINVCKDKDENLFYEDLGPSGTALVDTGVEAIKTYWTHSWRNICTINDVLFKLIDKSRDYDAWLLLTNGTSYAASTIHFLKHCVDYEFPALVPNRLARSFYNGVLVLEPDQETFYTFSEAALRPSVSIPSDLTCCKHYNIEFRTDLWNNYWWHMSTPQLSKILNDQQLQPQVQRIVFAMLGRLLYKVNALDKWQIIFFIRGVAQSGKSTIGNIAKLFYDAADVAIMSSNIEMKFGLDPISNAMLFICYEVTKSWSLPRSDFQSLISGEELSIAGKHKEARTIKWEVPGLLLGNEIGPWTNASGSMERRLLVCEFDHRIRESDPDMEKKLQEELPTIIYKCQQAYVELFNACGNQGIWERIPTYFKGIQQKISNGNNPIKQFIENEQSLYFNPAALMCLTDFQIMFLEFCKPRGLNSTQFTLDEYKSILEDIGFSIKHMTATINGQKKAGKHIIGIGKRGDGGPEMEEDDEKRVTKEELEQKISTQETNDFLASLPPVSSVAKAVCEKFQIPKTNCYLLPAQVIDPAEEEEAEEEEEEEAEGDDTSVSSGDESDHAAEAVEVEEIVSPPKAAPKPAPKPPTQQPLSNFINIGSFSSDQFGFRQSDIIMS